MPGAKRKLFFNPAEITRVFWILAVHAFLAFLFFILLGIIIGGYLFYKYAVPSDNQLSNNGTTAIFKYDLYQEVLGEWQAREEEFSEPPLTDAKQ